MYALNSYLQIVDEGKIKSPTLIFWHIEKIHLSVFVLHIFIFQAKINGYQSKCCGSGSL